MKTVIADMYYHKKHKKLNLSLIKGISSKASLVIVNKKGFYTNEDIGDNDSIDVFHYLPSKYDKVRNFCILLHLFLLYIRLCISKINYDSILFLSTNNICCNYAIKLGLFKGKKIVVIHHYDIDRTIDSIKETKMFQQTMNQYEHIVFAPFIKKGMIDHLGIDSHRVHIVPHPLFIADNNQCYNIERSNIIIGIGRNNSLSFMKTLVDIDQKYPLVNKNKIKMRTNGETYKGRNVEIFKVNDISQNEFNSILEGSKACVVIYERSYRYRYSGVIVDALSHGCTVICNDIPIGRYYADICPNNCMVIKNAADLFEIAKSSLKDFDIREFKQYLAANNNSVIIEKLYEVLV